ncbi:MAG: hypothetical protein JJ992_27140, partial [Planctomycetes bacterium]|nr:hypothetical protein [Planctomycetota bacterium]
MAIFAAACWIAGGTTCAQTDSVSSGKGTTYYVDSQGGKDSNSGRSERTPWRSLQRVNDAPLQPGDTVRFKCGGIWRGSLLPVSGEEDAPVTYTSYGSGPKPALLGSLPRNRPADWCRIGENVW